MTSLPYGLVRTTHACRMWIVRLANFELLLFVLLNVGERLGDVAVQTECCQLIRFVGDARREREL